jgi:putative FmdB family regulatory protein
LVGSVSVAIPRRTSRVHAEPTSYGLHGVWIMPIFEYKCQTCGETFESFTQRVTAPTPPVCPACGSKDAERLFSVFAGRSEGSSGCGSPAGGGG